MGNVLYLVHRLPYPPNKGDKVRSHHLLKHLARQHRVFLGTFIDDPEDEAHVGALRSWCADLHVARIRPLLARLCSLRGLWHGEPMTLAYYRNAGLQAWVDTTCREQDIGAAVIFSSAMMQYVRGYPQLLTLVDFVDVDSAKWSGYAEMRSAPMSWIYRREGRRLLAYERETARRATRSFFVTDQETALFQDVAPEVAGRVETMQNGVDANYFSPSCALPSPYQGNDEILVFTGAMDYFPNVDAVAWFALEVLPGLLLLRPRLKLYIVGRSPLPAVRALAGDRVIVAGTVPDVRPYLMHAAVVVAPLRLARGIQNKVLEALAMARPVVASHACAAAINAQAGRDFLAATSAEEFASRIVQLLDAPERATAMGESGRRQVLAHYSWDANMTALDRYLDVAPTLAVPHQLSACR